MSMDITGGEFVRGYLQSDTLLTAAAIPLFDADGNPRTLKAGERLVLYEIVLTNGATNAYYTVFCDTNGNGALDAGEELVSFSLVAAFSGSCPNAGGLVMGRRSDGANKNKLMVVSNGNSVGTRVNVVGQIIKS